MADLLKSNEIDAGGGYIADRGNWVSGFSETVDGITFTGYALNDIVHTAKAVYLSLVDNNTTNPDTDTTGSWRTFLDKRVVTDVQSKVDSFMSAWAVQNQMAGMARTNGSADPSAETLYGDSQVIKDIVRNFRLCTVKNGAVVKIGVAGRMTKATTGETIAVDGSEGDIGLCCLKPIHLLKALGKVNDVETNVCAVGQTPAYWNGIASRQIDAFALAPWGTVNCQLSGDARSQAHTVINDAAVGTYSTPAAIFKQTYKTSGGGYPSQYCSCVGSIQNAQNKNALATDGAPYMSGYYEFYEILLTLMMAELGTTAHNQLNLFGCGCTPLDSVSATTFNDAQISGNSGWKIFLADGSVAYQNLWGNEYVRLTSADTAKKSLIQGIAGNDYYGVCKCGEAQEVLDAIAEAGLIDKMGINSNIFTYAEDGTIQCISDGSVNVETGAGMTICKHYYIVRSVTGCLGMADGVMTAVVNSYTKMEFADGVVVNSSNASLTGCTAICKRSMPVYLGWALPIQGYFVQADGAFYVIEVDANGNQTITFRCAEKPSDIKGRSTFGFEAAVGGEADIEKGLSKVIRNVIPVGTSEGWVSKANYGMSLFCYTAFGGGSRSHESAYLWIYPSNNAGAGKRQVHGSVLGCHASCWAPYASCRTAACFHYAGNGAVNYVGSWSVPYLITNENN